MNVIETHSLTPEVQPPPTLLNTDEPPQEPDLRDREWRLYWDYTVKTVVKTNERRFVETTEIFKTVSIIKVYDTRLPYKVAVARAYCSPYDFFIKKKGYGIAKHRFDGLLSNYENRGIDFYMDTLDNFVIFQLTAPENILPTELNFFNQVIRPRLEGKLIVAKVSIE